MRLIGRVFVTGDKHCNFMSDLDYKKVEVFCKRFNTTTDDVMIVLGDHGVAYDGAWSDHHAKKKLGKLPITFVMIRGNHDMRPSRTWQRLLVRKPGVIEGWFYEDPDVKNILYTDEYGWYMFNDIRTFIIGGAYSVDKYYRIRNGKTLMYNRQFLGFNINE